MELKLAAVNAFLLEHGKILIFFLSAMFFACTYILLSRIFRIAFGLYRRRFYAQVDQGLRDVLVMLAPEQVFTITLGLALAVGPVVAFFTNVAVAGAFVAGIFLAPPLILKVMKKRRSALFVKQLPDALQAMSSALKSGLNLVKTLQQVIKNQPEPLAQEFAQVLVEYRIGTDLNDSFNELSKRIDRPEVTLMNAAIKINRAVGGNLADTFEALSSSLREKEKVEGRVMALTAMGQSQGRLAIGFPVFMGFVFYTQEPFAMSLLFTTPLGWMWLAGMAVMAIIGSVLIKKIVTIDV
jgi:tight adherence protein B